jgi:hypothetical protein
MPLRLYSKETHMSKITTSLNNSYYIEAATASYGKVNVLIEGLYWEAIAASQYIRSINYEGYMLK